MKIAKNRKYQILIFIGVIICSTLIGLLLRDDKEYSNIEVWRTSASKEYLMTRTDDLLWTDKPSTTDNLIKVNHKKELNDFEGYGAGLTHSSAYNLYYSDKKEQILTELFSIEEGIGLSFIRVPIGSSDFVAEVNGKQKHYTYDDMGKGETDVSLEQFTIAPDEEFIIPIIKEILEINPSVKVVGSPWSAPAWMKDSDSLFSGQLLPEYQEIYAEYFSKYILAYGEHGIQIDYITIQNEPHLSSSDYPVMYMDYTQQIDFIKNDLISSFDKHEIETKIIGWDHNYTDFNTGLDEDLANFGLQLLADKNVRKNIAGIGFHGYEANGIQDFGRAFDKIHEEYPKTSLFFTEISSGNWSPNFENNFDWQMKNVVIPLPNKSAEMILMWNIALDEDFGPFLGGCTNCTGLIEVEKNTDKYSKLSDFYSMGQISKFLKISDDNEVKVVEITNESPVVNAVAFILEDQTIVNTLYNQSSFETEVTIEWMGKYLNLIIEPRTSVTLIW